MGAFSWARSSVGRAFGSHPKGRGFDSLRVHKTPYRVERYGVSFCRSLQNRASFVLTAQSDVCRTFRHNVHSFTRSFVKNDDSPIRSTQPPNGCLFKVRFPPTRSTHRERMTLKFFKLLQRNIEDDLNIIIPSNTDFLDELVEDCLPLLKGCVLIGACPSEQIRNEPSTMSRMSLLLLSQ